MKKNLIILTVFFILICILITGCSKSKGTPEDTINNFIQMHYIINKDNLDLYGKYYKNQGDYLEEITESYNCYNDVLTKNAFENFKGDRSGIFKFHTFYMNDCTSEVENINIKEVKEEDNMKCFNMSFKWIIKNESGATVKDFNIDKKIYLSEDHGSWFINEFNNFDYLDENFTLTSW